MDTERVAQTTLTCFLCNQPILPGHKYVWLQTTLGTLTKVNRVHPDCEEIRINGLTNSRRKRPAFNTPR